MNAFYKGKPIFGPRGPAGPDGNPVGTVISFLGLTAPAGYLVCDGAEYEITAYPDLADHFRQQFGAANHFGGNGTDTFCVPDMRNLFLRGYHGAAAEQRSGDIGKMQAATEIPDIYNGRSQNGSGYIGARVLPILSSQTNMNAAKNIDKAHMETSTVTAFVADSVQGIHGASSYETRPVNTAVLYCVKAI